VPQTTSGPATGALVAGIGSLLAMLLVGCFGAVGARADVGALVGGAFGMLSLALGAAGIGLGLVGLRQIRRYGVGGRGLAVAGIACGVAGGGLSRSCCSCWSRRRERAHGRPPAAGSVTPGGRCRGPGRLSRRASRRGRAGQAGVPF
jgi:hypothetical protein